MLESQSCRIMLQYYGRNLDSVELYLHMMAGCHLHSLDVHDETNLLSLIST